MTKETKDLGAAPPRSLTDTDLEDVLRVWDDNSVPWLMAGELRSARKLLGRWAEADHCHGHICDSDPDGPCEVRRLEIETRAFLRSDSERSEPEQCDDGPAAGSPETPPRQRGT